jgi:hypothetical protein
MAQSEDTPLRIHYTDRQSVPVPIDITSKEGTIKLTDNSNFFCLGPSGSGKYISYTEENELKAIINNSDVVMLLDQSKFRERFDNIRSILGLTDVDCKKIFIINRLDNKEGRSFFREVFIRRGAHSGMYGVEESREC